MRTNAIHPVEHSLGLAVKISFNTKRWKFVGNDPYRPPWSVALRSRPAVETGTVCLYLRWGLGLIAVAERTEAALDFDLFSSEVSGALGAIGRNNYPAADDRIFSKLGQYQNPFRGTEDEPRSANAAILTRQEAGT
jgi:hypothetical protein